MKLGSSCSTAASQILSLNSGASSENIVKPAVDGPMPGRAAIFDAFGVRMRFSIQLCPIRR